LQNAAILKWYLLTFSNISSNFKMAYSCTPSNDLLPQKNILEPDLLCSYSIKSRDASLEPIWKDTCNSLLFILVTCLFCIHVPISHVYITKFNLVVPCADLYTRAPRSHGTSHPNTKRQFSIPLEVLLQY
jgi:hypothetical protein